ncbi:MAG: hypothetical protein AAFR65_03520 [Pseudomonadota bacterium]
MGGVCAAALIGLSDGFESTFLYWEIVEFFGFREDWADEGFHAVFETERREAPLLQIVVGMAMYLTYGFVVAVPVAIVLGQVVWAIADRFSFDSRLSAVVFGFATGAIVSLAQKAIVLTAFSDRLSSRNYGATLMSDGHRTLVGYVIDGFDVFLTSLMGAAVGLIAYGIASDEAFA